MTSFKTTLKRIRFYLVMLGGFLGIEIPLFMFTYFQFFPKFRNLVIFFTIIISIAAALFVFFIIARILKEDFEIQLIFGNHEYETISAISGETNEKI